MALLLPLAAASALFKFANYFFLRWIPSSHAIYALPSLFLLYLSCWFLATPLPPNSLADAPSIYSPQGLYRVLVSHRTTTRPLSWAALLLNALFFTCSLDFVLRPRLESYDDLTFSRVGAVQPTSVKISLRYPDMSDGVMILWRSNSSASDDVSWLSGPVVHPDPENDWLAVATLDGLNPGHVYQYRLAHPNASFLPTSAHTFRTFPDPRVTSGAKFRFMVSSCVLPNFPYIPFGANRIPGFDKLSQYLSSHFQDIHRSIQLNSTLPSPIEFLLFLGDFIYADVPYYFGASSEAYTRMYRRNYASSSFRAIYEQLPIFHIYDDHEFYNNFAGGENDTATTYLNASHPFNSYQGIANYDPIHTGQHYYTFQYGDAAFFVLDTRRYRSREFTDLSKHTMLGDQQLAALHTWIGKVNSTATYKFIVSSVPFTTLWNGDSKVDSWAGFQDERDALLATFATVPNTFVLSGDRHEFAAIEQLGPVFGSIIEISTSPLSMFWLPVPGWLKLQPRSKRLVLRKNESESSWVPEEQVIKYIPSGNYKWSTIEVDTTTPGQPKLSLEVVIDGRTAWSRVFPGLPVDLQLSTSLTSHLSNLLGNVFDSLPTIPNPIARFLTG
ncbi:Metallo-dependent phosphatase [Sistotremastrum niveocremeum HHB9708]|uniref:Metallo-dependent phosphatase n=2 Tax=Sistotremastraceae TaxID=3402574 RepID=A0A165ANA7_9AGAM|nr:Metallo-dependent phosphatase [Sistotremastrum niveocremeum HHB9708]KZT37001.1 Metallo-dependent phosphatase [Sistotremastrum suecicum HHB10207 ss-3]